MFGYSGKHLTGKNVDEMLPAEIETIIGARRDRVAHRRPAASPAAHAFETRRGHPERLFKAMLSLAGCLGIDVVSFLTKMKADIHKFKMDIDALRNPTPPQYFKEITRHLHLTGKGITEKQVERAVHLSQEKYCSVYHSLRKDLVVKVSYTITDVEGPHVVK